MRYVKHNIYIATSQKINQRSPKNHDSQE